MQSPAANPTHCTYSCPCDGFGYSWQSVRLFGCFFSSFLLSPSCLVGLVCLLSSLCLLFSSRSLALQSADPSWVGWRWKLPWGFPFFGKSLQANCSLRVSSFFSFFLSSSSSFSLLFLPPLVEKKRYPRLAQLSIDMHMSRHCDILISSRSLA